jgi:peroxiredoxin
MQGFVEAQDEFKQLGAQVLGMSVDSWAAANAFAESLGAEFPLLGDFPFYTTSKAYGVFDEERHLARRVTFVIDGERVIRAVIDEPREMDKHSKDALEEVRKLTGAAGAASA